MKTYAVIPVRDQANLACNVIALAAKEANVFVFDNGSTADTRVALEEFECGNVGIHDAAGKGLYQMWDEAWTLAHIQTNGEPYNIAFLNSDIDFVTGTLGVLATVMRDDSLKLGCVCPDYELRVAGTVGLHPCESWSSRVKRVTGSYRHRGVSGWCFMVRGELFPDVEVDTSYEIWAGDDDLFFQIERAGYALGVVQGLPLDHVGSATLRNFPELEARRGSDMEKLRAKWGAR